MGSLQCLLHRSLAKIFSSCLLSSSPRLFFAVVDLHTFRNLNLEEATVIWNGEQWLSPLSISLLGTLSYRYSWVLFFSSTIYYYTQPDSGGNCVPADIRNVEASSDLHFDHSLLIGEGRLQHIFYYLLPYSILTFNKRYDSRNCYIHFRQCNGGHDLALNSTFVVQGKYTGVVFATGDRTIMGCIVGMSGDNKGKSWFFVTIISAVALELFCISMIVWAAWLRNTFPGFEDASYSIGCLTLRTCRITARLNIELITFTLIELHRALLPPRSAGITLTN